MSKPIKKDCTAIVKNDDCIENIGKIVTVGKFIGLLGPIDLGDGASAYSSEDDWWEVDKPMAAIAASAGHKARFTMYYQQEQYLERLDDDENKVQETNRIKEEV